MRESRSSFFSNVSSPHASLLSSIVLKFWCLCLSCLYFSHPVILALWIYIPSSSSHPLSPLLFSWLLNQCLKCVSKVSLAQYLSTATHYLPFQEICMCGRVCVSPSPLSPHTTAHPSICPISTCAEAQPPGKLTNESLPQPSVTFLAAFCSFNSSLHSIPPSLTCLCSPPCLIFVMRHSTAFVVSDLVWLLLMSLFNIGQKIKAQYVLVLIKTLLWLQHEYLVYTVHGTKGLFNHKNDPC